MRTLKQRKNISRVDVQVCIIAAVIVVLSFTCVYAFNYTVTYNEMIDTLKDRCDGISAYVDDVLDTSTFEGIDSPTDMNEPSYLAMQSSLEQTRVATGARYLYTAKRTGDGSFIYVVDGLPSDSEDFREPGDPIESEILPEMNRALDGEVVYPSDIMDTGWGSVFVAYYPIHVDGEVAGVLGIEFDAQRQYEAFHIVRVGTPLIALGFLLAAIVVSWLVFRRVSNPWYRDMANTDYLTGLKNRNAYEVDIANLDHGDADRSMGVVSVDLDGLKEVNDALGHAAGDEYIAAAARIVADACEAHGPVYRIGGDEFVALCFDLDEPSIQALADRMQERARKTAVRERMLSLSVGCTMRLRGESIGETLHRADGRMYEQKRARHARSETAGSGDEPTPS